MRTRDGLNPKANQLSPPVTGRSAAARRKGKAALAAAAQAAEEAKTANKTLGKKPRTCPEYIPPPGHATTDNAVKIGRYKLAHQAQPVVPLDKLDDTGLAEQSRTALRVPERLQEWLDGWTQPDTQGEKADVDAAADLIAALQLDREAEAAARTDRERPVVGGAPRKAAPGPTLEDRENYGLAPHLRRFQQSILQFVGALARGLPMNEVEHHGGITSLRVRILAKSDPDGLGKLLALAQEQRAVAQKEIYEDELQRRVIDGDATAMFGRTGLNTDGEIGVQVKRDPKLLELALTRADPQGAAAVSAAKKAAEAAATQEAKGGTNIGSAVIFNISGIPEWFEEASGLGKQTKRVEAEPTMPSGMLTPPDKLDLPDNN